MEFNATANNYPYNPKPCPNWFLTMLKIFSLWFPSPHMPLSLASIPTSLSPNCCLSQIRHLLIDSTIPVPPDRPLLPSTGWWNSRLHRPCARSQSPCYHITFIFPSPVVEPMSPPSACRIAISALPDHLLPYAGCWNPCLYRPCIRL